MSLSLEDLAASRAACRLATSMDVDAIAHDALRRFARGSASTLASIWLDAAPIATGSVDVGRRDPSHKPNGHRDGLARPHGRPLHDHFSFAGDSHSRNWSSTSGPAFSLIDIPSAGIPLWDDVGCSRRKSWSGLGSGNFGRSPCNCLDLEQAVPFVRPVNWQRGPRSSVLGIPGPSAENRYKALLVGEVGDGPCAASGCDP
jgi:hypothetical protein